MYSLVSYLEAWFRLYHPSEYFVAEFDANEEKDETLRKYVREAGVYGVSILPPDVNASLEGFTLTGKEIRFGLYAVGHVGHDAAKAIVEGRQAHGPYASVGDLRARIPKKLVNSGAIQSLICAGAFDSVGANRGVEWSAVERSKPKSKKSPAAAEKVSALLDEAERGWSVETLARQEYASLGFYLGSNPLESPRVAVERRKFSGGTPVSGIPRTRGVFTTFGIVDSVEEIKTRQATMMGKITLGDETGSADLVLYAETWQKYKHLFVEGGVVAVTTQLSKSGKFTLAGDRAYVARLF